MRLFGLCAGFEDDPELTINSTTPVLTYGNLIQSNSTDSNQRNLESQEPTQREDLNAIPQVPLHSNHFEFVVEKIFTDYKNLFQKEYKDPKEHVKRKDIFRHNLR